MHLLVVTTLVGLVVLVRAADQLVVGGARVALGLRVSTVAVGVLIAVGTTAPELVVSGIAAGQGSLDIAVGNIVGSNVANLTLVLGVAALVAPVVVDRTTVRGEAPVSIAAVAAFAILVHGSFGRLEAAALVGGLAAALFWIFRRSQRGDPQLLEQVREVADPTASPSLGAEALRTVFGLAGTLLGAYLLVFGARGIAEEAGLAEGLIGLTLVAVGTSLPELITGIHAARRGEHGLLIGTLLGANMLNSLAVAGVAGLIGPGAVDPALTGATTVVMVAVCLTAWGFMHTRLRVARWEGALLVAAYPALVLLVGAG